MRNRRKVSLVQRRPDRVAPAALPRQHHQKAARACMRAARWRARACRGASFSSSPRRTRCAPGGRRKRSSGRAVGSGAGAARPKGRVGRKAGRPGGPQEAERPCGRAVDRAAGRSGCWARAGAAGQVIAGKALGVPSIRAEGRWIGRTAGPRRNHARDAELPRRRVRQAGALPPQHGVRGHDAGHLL